MPVIGTQQSPIQIVTSNAITISKPEELFRIEYEDRVYHGVFAPAPPGHGNFELDTAPYPKVFFKSKSDAYVYELRRIHIHLKSEHLIDSMVQRDYEVHLLHVRQGMTLTDPKLVIGILYHESFEIPSGRGLERFNKLLKSRSKAGSSLRDFKANDAVPDGNINPRDFFPRAPDGKAPDFKNWFHYEGSLTSEPYSEDVSWFVMKSESGVTPDEDLVHLKKYAEQDARQTYALNRRIVVKSFE